MSISVGLIGLGRIGAGFEKEKLRAKPATHLGAWRAIEGVHIDNVCDSDRHLLNTVQAEYKIHAGYYDYRLMLRENTFDIVSVATPPETHEEIVQKIIEIRKPEVIFCEKPISLTVESAQRMVDLCKKNGVKLGCNHVRRWDPFWQEVASMIKEKRDSLVYSIANYTGGTLQVGIHMADLLNWFGIDDDRLSFVEYSNAEMNYLLFELDIFFKDGRLNVIDNGLDYALYESQPSEWYDGINELKYIHGTDNPLRWTVEKTPMLRACEQLKCCAETEEEPLATGMDGLLALKRCLGWMKK